MTYWSVDIGELEDVLHLSTLTNGYELSAQEISQRLAAVGTRLSDEAGQVFGTEVGEKIQRMFTPRLLLEGEQVTPNALRNATNKVIRDAGKSIDQANPVGQTLRDRILTRQPVGQVESKVQTIQRNAQAALTYDPATYRP